MNRKDIVKAKIVERASDCGGFFRILKAMNINSVNGFELSGSSLKLDT